MADGNKSSGTTRLSGSGLATTRHSRERLNNVPPTHEHRHTFRQQRSVGHTLKCRAALESPTRDICSAITSLTEEDNLRSASRVADVPSMRGAPMMKSANSTPFGRNSTDNGDNPSTTSTHSIFGLWSPCFKITMSHEPSGSSIAN